MNKLNFTAVAILIFWAGFVCSISFMEAWLKFQAPGVTLPIGLSIGRKVFTALNRVEWVLFAGNVLLIGVLYQFKPNKTAVLTLLLAVVLLLQTFYLLPELDRRALQIIGGENLPGSVLHVFYVILEVLKVGLLVYFSYYLYKIQTIKISEA